MGMIVPLEMWIRKGMTAHILTGRVSGPQGKCQVCLYTWVKQMTMLDRPLEPFWCQRCRPVGERWCIWLVLTAVRHSQGAGLMQEKSREEGKSSAPRWVWLLLCDSMSSFQQVLNLIFRKTTHTHSHTVSHYIQIFLSLSLYSKWQNHRLHTPSWGTGHIHLYACAWTNISSLKLIFWYNFSIIKLCA